MLFHLKNVQQKCNIPSVKIPEPCKSWRSDLPYVVHIPRSIFGGKQKRKFFKSEKAAREYCQKLKREIEQHGSTFLNGLNDQERFQVQQFILNLRNESEKRPINLENVVNEFYETQKKLGVSKAYLTEIRYLGGKLKKDLGERIIKSLQGKDILDWVTNIPLSQTTQFNAFKIARAVFAFALSQNYISSNPLTGLSKKIKRPRSEKEILEPQQLKKFLTFDNLYWRVFTSLRAFAGLRSCEVWRGDWADINWDSKEIFVHPESAKQVQGARTEGRIITLNETLAAWLKPLAKTSGKFIEVSFTTMRRIQKKALQLAGLDDMPQNALRHSFATYHYALHSNAPLTAKEMGHTTMKITFGSYARRGISRVDGEAWFAIKPKHIKTLESPNKK